MRAIPTIEGKVKAVGEATAISSFRRLAGYRQRGNMLQYGKQDVGIQCGKPCSRKMPALQKLQPWVKRRVCQRHNSDSS